MGQTPRGLNPLSGRDFSGDVTKDEAKQQVQAYLSGHEVDSPGLNDKGLGGASLELGDIYFEYLPEQAALKCNALIYRFRKPPNPAVIDAFYDEGTRTDTGGGEIDFQVESQSVFLARVYDRRVDAKTFAAELDTLLAASHLWRNEVVVRVADQAYGRKP